ncbi:T-cell immunomodulatory protein [Microplitis mediator]|uniref:T-cell immunomodulatory protein n=1 Tax=Microplitis mediator TaxID=375433 RepID=UPI002552C631|nr:T-cell immunomodulatory protein [Microplitis mediator]
METKKILLLLLITIATVSTSDITSSIFGSFLEFSPAAFGDFNSDELTDVFALTKDSKTLEILLAHDQEPILRPSNLTCSFKNSITSVVPGDYDGDVFMDVLVTTYDSSLDLTQVHIIWGGIGAINCSNESEPFISMRGQPLAIDYNQDMIIDLLGTDIDNQRTFWINHNRTKPEAIPMEKFNQLPLEPMKSPHSNSFLDLNGDFLPDLMITTDKYFEVWHGVPSGFKHFTSVEWPFGVADLGGHVGQSFYLDIELKGELDLVVPLCFDYYCRNSTIAVYHNGWHNLQINFADDKKEVWGFVPPDSWKNVLYTNAITLHAGDFNMDGYPDILATLQTNKGNKIRAFLLENIPCDNCGGVNRTFEVHWSALDPFQNESVMGVFYDFYQDGVLDVILVEYDKTTSQYHTRAFKNSLDYDANFIKVMVLTGLTNSKYPISPGSLGKKKRTYGTNLPGPSIAYETKTQEGYLREAIAAQLPQSAYFSLNLPYTTFGLGRTPNYIDTLTIGVAGKHREWLQIIPNSQMVVIPNPINEANRWKAQLFVTPSKLILLSAAALTGTCGLISAIIMALYWKERREDKIERLQEAHRFHFDAM